MTCISLSMRAWLAACALLVAPLARAGGGPENVFLIVNPRGAKSKEVANHYVQMRQIPPDNVYYLPLPPSANEMKALDFREKLLRPALTAIERRGLQDQIDYIVYSCEFPWRVDFAEMFPQLASNPQLRPMASLTGATFLHQFVNEGSDSLVQLHTN
ncbi:MAG TPA: hypothetical protein PKC18_12375, partial [Lacipirellulaceae bacterium]|nr:hypothetical protein [Lacipirellulaceae bacterium]